ncbi:Protein kinase domain-containing protein [Mycena sanguinolenta]|uniref:Protein kinase domain-containing protein n=1 Tax=Mycena sanguinolenta TaxID=230812 RepID=A0A8H6ZEK3_9AGAR|nr:Protein kinase domain-containing protein [Mycena sanguinolenta]
MNPDKRLLDRHYASRLRHQRRLATNLDGILRNYSARDDYGVWFVRYIWDRTSGSTLTPPWWAICGNSDASSGSLWLWEDEDEEYLKRFAAQHSVAHIRVDDHSDGAYLALAATRAANPTLAHLTPEMRFRFIAWLMVAGPLRKDRILQDTARSFPSIDMLISDWAISTALRGAAPAIVTCSTCGVSDVLPVWIETLSKIYSVEDLRTLPWSRSCKCLDNGLTARMDLGQSGMRLGTDSPVLHVLYELVVPAWSLFHWATLRNMLNDRNNDVDLLDQIRGGDPSLFAWDAQDNLDVCRVLSDCQVPQKVNRPTLYPRYWVRCMVEIGLETWREISTLTQTANRRRRGSYDLGIRLIAVLLEYSSTPTYRNILTPLGFSLDGLAFDTMARAVDKTYQERPAQESILESKELRTNRAKLEHWLSVRNETLCHRVWHSRPGSSSLERVQVMDLVLNVLPQHLATYTYSLMPQHPNPEEYFCIILAMIVLISVFRGLNTLLRLKVDGTSGCLESLQRYSSDVQILVSLIKQSVKVRLPLFFSAIIHHIHCPIWQKDPRASINHAVARSVYERMNYDLAVVVTRFVLFLRNPESYKQFLTCRGADAQQLLDLLQDLLDLNSFPAVKPSISNALLRLSRCSGLHPRCFVLSGLQRLGQQVSGGGFGDIWKGSVRGQNVCVKIMRIFGNSNIKAALKEFGREAVIWRQLYHPNVLPFFGLYYVDDRLCLVSPWMGDGHIIDFLRNHKPTDTKRLSLILDVALGLEYLHKQRVVHGDLKGLNILVTPSHRACIADFGVSSIADDITVRFTHSTVTARAGTSRYQAPELFRVDNPAKIHYGSDVYAFACVCYEILTGQVPFHELRSDMAVMMKVAGGYRPQRPKSCSRTTAFHSLWELMQKCWHGEEGNRPTTPKIVESLSVIGAKTKPLATDWDEEATSKFRRSLQAEPLLPSVAQIERLLFHDA